jgi:paraquat-inducible protein B
MSGLRPALVGGFVLGGAVLVVATILLFGGTRLFSPTVAAVVYFKGSVANLEVGAPVTFRGVRVGSVTAIAVSLDMADLTARIPVFLELNPAQISLQGQGRKRTSASFDRLLKAGLRAQLNMQSLITGQLLVDLDLLPNTEAILVGDGRGRTEIPAIPSRLQTIESAIVELPLKEMVENANQALAAIRQLAESASPRVAPLADSLLRSSEAAQATLQRIDRLADLGEKQIGDNGAALARLLASADLTLRDADKVLASVQDMVAANGALRGDLGDSLRDLSASAGALRGFTHEIERDPSSLFRGRSDR